MPFAAMTYIVALMQPLPVFGPASSLYVMKLIPLTTIVRVDQNLAGDGMIHQLRAVVGRLVQA